MFGESLVVWGFATSEDSISPCWVSRGDFLIDPDAFVSRVFKAKYFPWGISYPLGWVTDRAMSLEACV